MQVYNTNSAEFYIGPIFIALLAEKDHCKLLLNYARPFCDEKGPADVDASYPYHVISSLLLIFSFGITNLS